MLAGQEIGVYETLIISLLGISIVMISLFLLMLFIMVLSKLLVSMQKKPEIKIDVPKIPDEDIAAIAAALCVETGLSPEQFKIKFIVESI